MRLVHALLVFIASGCGASSPRDARSVTPTVSSQTAAPASEALDACQRATLSAFRNAPVAPRVLLLSTPGIPDVDAKAASYNGWLRALGAHGSPPIAYRWLAVDDEASRKLAQNAGLSADALAKPSDARGVVLPETYLGVVFEYGVEGEAVPLGRASDTNGVAWIARAARKAASRAEGRSRSVGFVVGGSVDGGVLLNASELAASNEPASRQHDFASGLERSLPSHRVVPIELAKDVPPEIDVLLLSQPGHTISDRERQAIDAFLMRGNKTLVVVASAADVAPNGGAMRVDVQAHGVSALLGPYGVDLKADVVVDGPHALAVDVVRGDGTRGSVSVPGVPIAEVDDASAPFFGLGRVAFPFASTLALAQDRQPEAKLRVIARTSASSKAVTASAVDLGPGAPLPAGGGEGARAVAVEVRGQIRSAFGGQRAPATIFVFSSSLMPTNPFAWTGNAPPLSGNAPPLPLPGDATLQALAPAYAPQLSRAVVALMNAIDAQVVDDDVRACNAVFLSGTPSVRPVAASGARPERLEPERRGALLPKEAIARVTGIRIEEPGRSVSLARDGATWRVSSLGAVPANAENARRALENLAEASMGDAIAADARADALLGLAPGAATRVVLTAGNEALLDVTMGRHGMRGTAVRISGKPEARLATGISDYLYHREARFWRNLDIWELDQDAVKRIAIESGTRRLVLTADHGSWRATLDGRPFTALAQDRARDLVRAFRKLAAEDVADASEKTGLDKDAAVVRFELEGGRQHVLHVGKARSGKGGDAFARADGDPTVYVIPSYVASWLDLNRFRPDPR